MPPGIARPFGITLLLAALIAGLVSVGFWWASIYIDVLAGDAAGPRVLEAGLAAALGITYFALPLIFIVSRRKISYMWVWLTLILLALLGRVGSVAALVLGIIIAAEDRSVRVYFRLHPDSGIISWVRNRVLKVN